MLKLAFSLTPDPKADTVGATVGRVESKAVTTGSDGDIDSGVSGSSQMPNGERYT